MRLLKTSEVRPKRRVMRSSLCQTPREGEVWALEIGDAASYWLPARSPFDGVQSGVGLCGFCRGCRSTCINIDAKTAKNHVKLLNYLTMLLVIDGWRRSRHSLFGS
jgi:hypothetical protein